MNRLHLLLVLVLSTFYTTVFAQQERNCHAMDVLEAQKAADPSIEDSMNAIERHTQDYVNNHSEEARVNGVITIPVVVHVIYSNSQQNISDAQILSQIQVLNEDFRRTNSDQNNLWSQAVDTEIEFCMASVDPNGNPTNGITRKSSSTSSWGTNDAMKYASQGGVNAWPASDYLNMWVCNIGGGILGYAQFPGGAAATDGVVMSPQYFGNTGYVSAPFNLGRTATHEVGHWLNLRHIWGDGNCNADDFVSDTPTSDAANYGCASGHVSCNSTDMVQNYMDYSDDACMNLYTAGQKTRMRALFNSGGFRASLLNSNACGSSGGGGGNEPTCSDGIQNGDETGVDCGGSCSACDTGCSGETVSLSITLDNYPEETSWSIVNASGATVYSGGTYGDVADGTTLSGDLCLDSGCYDFIINDAYGDGICCSYGNGSYSLTSGGSTLASGGSFGSSETTNFCVGGTPPPAPTCNDGVQNGNETGVDCGGSCNPCSSCNDGVQNGNETGVDCGGSCNPCVSCNDGIQNGDEEGVDCGGSNCEPCEAGPCSYVTINSNNFDSSWGIWNDGGSDCRRSTNDAAYAYSGNRCVRLRDNTSSSTTTTDNLNLSAYEEVTIDFTYYPRSMDNSNEDFWLQVSTNGGSSYITVEEWNRGDEFENNQRYFESVTMVGTFTSTTKFRFRCDASSNVDYIYIDDVVITGCVNSARQSAPVVNNDPLVAVHTPTQVQESVLKTETELEIPALSNMQLFPNPTSDMITLTYQSNDANNVNLVVTDVSGKVVINQVMGTQSGDQKTRVDLSDVQAGIYLVHLITDGVKLSEKVVVIK